MSVEELRRRLIDRSVPLNVTLATPQVDQLQTYFELLVRWNRRINLTALPLEPLGDETLDGCSSSRCWPPAMCRLLR